MVGNSNTSHENEIHRADSPSDEDSKNTHVSARKALTSGEGLLGNLGKRSKTGKSITMQIRELSILIRNTGLYSLVPKIAKSLHCCLFGFPAC